MTNHAADFSLNPGRKGCLVVLELAIVGEGGIQLAGMGLGVRCSEGNLDTDGDVRVGDCSDLREMELVIHLACEDFILH